MDGSQIMSPSKEKVGLCRKKLSKASRGLSQNLARGEGVHQILIHTEKRGSVVSQMLSKKRGVPEAPIIC